MGVGPRALEDLGLADVGSPAPTLVYFGHHRCGTTWLTRVMSGLAGFAGLGRSFVETSQWHTEESLGQLFTTDRPEVLAVRNATPMSLAALPPHRGFHVIRDPRDVVVSGYFSHRFSHPLVAEWAALPKLRAELEGLSVEDGIMREIEFAGGTLGAMRRWPYDRAEVLELRLEDLMEDPFGGLLRVGAHLGVVDDRPLGGREAARFARDRMLLRLPRSGRANRPRWRARVPRDAWLGLLWDNRFEALAGRPRGDEDVKSHFRKGTPGSWREVFTPDHAAAFKERYPGLLETLGYEAGPDWSVDLASPSHTSG